MADIKVLIVVDGIFRLGPQDQQDDTFTIDKLISILRSNVSPSISVDTANRNDDVAQNHPGIPGPNPPSFPDPWATIPGNFNFATSVPNLSVYNEIWMLAYSGSNPVSNPPTLNFIGDDEISAIAGFMDRGGGVLASGDHAGLGSLMCGLIPRVRTMRKWFSKSDTDPRIPAPTLMRNWDGGGPERADTLQPDADGMYNFDSQSDDIPQPLLPVGGTHPLLQSPNGPITKFPDHMHEGEVLGSGGVPGQEPWTLKDTPTFMGHTFVEYPTLNGHQEVPAVIAKGKIIKNHTTPRAGAPCEDRNFFSDTSLTSEDREINILSVYDGHAVGVGRVITDSSFHHYMDLNLVGDPCSSTSARKLGFQTAAGKPTLDGMATFFTKAAQWLAGPRVDAWLAVNKNSFGLDEVRSQLHMGSSKWPASLWLILDGFSPVQVQAAGLPDVTSNLFSQNVMRFAGPGMPELHNQDTTPQRIAYPIELDFATQAVNTTVMGGVFPVASNPPNTYEVDARLTISGQPLMAIGEVELVGGADPYFSNVDYTGDGVYYLSQDLRVFTVTPGLEVAPVKDPAVALAAPVLSVNSKTDRETSAGFDYIKDLLTYLNSNYSDNSHGDPFTHFPNQSGALTGDSSVRPSVQDPRSPSLPRLTTYNFAVARVRLNGSTKNKKCRVFFRLWTAQSPDTDFQPTTTYLSSPPLPSLPESPLVGAGTSTIPFFATGNFETNADFGINTDYGSSGVNNRPIGVDDGAVHYAYFGCYLNVYPVDNKITIGGAPTTVLGLLPGDHHCLVAQIAFDDAPITSVNNITVGPQNSDKLAQRNLQITKSDNPGPPETHLIPQTFDIRPTKGLGGFSGQFASTPDELMVDWGNTPPGSIASIYWPQVMALDVITLARKLYTTHQLSVSATDPNTIECHVPNGLTYIPIPFGDGENLAGLITIQLPQDLVQGQEFLITVRRLASRRFRDKVPTIKSVNVTGHTLNKPIRATNWRYVTGSFAIKIPVTIPSDIIPEERDLQAITAWKLNQLSPSNRWYKVLKRYLSYINARVNGLGAGCDPFVPSPAGAAPLIPKDSGHGHHHHHRCGSHRSEPGPYCEYTGKVTAVTYDGCGRFEGFTLLTEEGCEEAFRGSEGKLADVVVAAWKRGDVVHVRTPERDRGSCAAVTIRADDASC
jgi:hypothetical protein